MAVKGSITLKDNASSVLQNIRSEEKKLSSETKKTKSVLKSAFDKGYKLKADVKDAKSKIKGIISETKKLKPVTAVIRAKDTATKVVKKVETGLRSVNKNVVRPTIKVLDKASKPLKSVLSLMGKVGKASKKLVVPLAAAGAVGTAALGGAVYSGMQLEQQQISIEHFVGATNKDLSESEVKSQSSSFISSLRANANATPFETGEVISAGSRAIALSNGSVSEAMGLVTLAEDMAAASGGTKSLQDAIEALGDLKVGETERLKEFGFKVSAEDFKKKGFSGITGELDDFYGGAASKLASSGSGLISTITGKLKSSAADFGLGIVEQLKPVLNDIISLIDQAQPYMQSFSQAVGQGLGAAIGVAKNAFIQLQPAVALITPILSQIGTAISTVGSSIGTSISTILPNISSLAPVFNQVGTVISAIGSGIGTAISAIAPVVLPIFEQIGQKVSTVVSILAEKSGFISSVIGTCGSAIAEVISTAWTIVGPVLDLTISAFETVLSVAEAVWPKVQSVIEGFWNGIKPVFEKIGSAVEAVGGAFKKVAGFFGFGGGSNGSGGGNKKPGKNAKGTNSWKGGPTWVGEKGPELIDLPQGTRILPTKESIRVAAMGNIIKFPKGSDGGDSVSSRSSRSVVINKVADVIQVRDDKDIDDISEKTAQKVLEALDNIA